MKKELVKLSSNKSRHGKKAASLADDYLLESQIATLRPENYLGAFSGYLRAFYAETDQLKKYASLPLIEKSLFQFQRAYPESDIGPLLDLIMLSRNSTDSPHALEIIKIGFNAMVREGVQRIGTSIQDDSIVMHERPQEINPDVRNYFDWTMGLLARRLPKAEDANDLQQLFLVFPEIKRAIFQRPKLATSQYFELCADLVNIAPIRELRTDLDRTYKQPHEIKRSKEIAEENAIINDAHFYGLDGIFTLMSIFAERIDNIAAMGLPYHPDVKGLGHDIACLFSPAGTEKLKSKKLSEMNGENRILFEKITHQIGILIECIGPSLSTINNSSLPSPGPG